MKVKLKQRLVNWAFNMVDSTKTIQKYFTYKFSIFKWFEYSMILLLLILQNQKNLCHFKIFK